MQVVLPAAPRRRPPLHRPSASPSVQLVVEASGDLLIHSAVFERALVLGGGRHYDFVPLFAQIEPYILGADLALCHVETPMTPAAPAGYPTFNTPPALATAIAQTGWRACSTAGTHALDQGQRGVDGTIRALDRAGVAHTGTFSSAAAQQTPLIMAVRGIRVAFLAYTELTNGIPSPHPWSVNRASAARILSDAHRARADGARSSSSTCTGARRMSPSPAASSSPWPARSPAPPTSPRSSASTCTSSSPSAS
jgi:poly-gamma-glutamate synthesis protein (capsule biosynthesis protein)